MNHRSALVDRFLGSTDAPNGGVERSSPRGRAGPVMIPVEDKVSEIETVVDILRQGAGLEGEAPQGWSARRARQRGRVSRDGHGVVRLNGRRCCIQLARSIDRRIHLLQMPCEVTCPECGANYVVQMGIQNG